MTAILENDKLKPFIKDLKMNLEILSKFTDPGLKKKYKIQKMMQAQHVMII